MISKSLFDHGLKGAYLAPLILFFQHASGGASLGLALISLAGAVVSHGILRSVFGPGGPEENPLESSTAVQRFYAVVFGVGPPEKFPESHLGILFESSNIPISKIQSVKIIFIIITGFAWFYSNGLALYKLISSGIPDSTPVLILYFAFVVWLLQIVIWEWFDPVHLEDMIEYDTGEVERDEGVDDHTEEVTEIDSN